MQKVVIIDGSRTPFLKSGTDYMNLMSYQLGGFAIKGLLTKTGIEPSEIDAVIMGNVISNIETPNVAREAALMAGVPNTTPCRTVSGRGVGPGGRNNPGRQRVASANLTVPRPRSISAMRSGTAAPSTEPTVS